MVDISLDMMATVVVRRRALPPRPQAAPERLSLVRQHHQPTQALHLVDHPQETRAQGTEVP